MPRLYLRVSCKGNPGPGRWAVALESNSVWETRSGGERSTTNNRMELRAALEGLQLLPPGSKAQVFTASDYLFQGITRWAKGWRSQAWVKKDGQPVANADLWRPLVELADAHQIQWVNAKGQKFEGLERASKALEAK
ncbi:MAG TPA: ribonuclease H [Promineifilum sp.]|nr:ribonuclease H [Promineifilum sp.]